MIILTVVFGAKDTQWQACFDSEERMRRAAFEGGVLQTNFSDDYGTSIMLSAMPTAIQVRDTCKAQVAEIEIMLHNARTQNKAQRAAATDPVLNGPQLAMPNGAGVNFRQ